MQPNLTTKFQHFIVENEIDQYKDVIYETYKSFIDHRIKLLNINLSDSYVENRTNEFCNCIRNTDITIFICKKDSFVSIDTIIGFIFLKKITDVRYNAYVALHFENIKNDKNINIFDVLRCLLILNKKICIEKSISAEGYSHIEQDYETISKLKELGAQVSRIEQPVFDQFQDPNINSNLSLYVKIVLTSDSVAIPSNF